MKIHPFEVLDARDLWSKHNSGAPRAPKARARGAPLLRKYGNPSIREILVMTSSYDRPTDRPSDRPTVRTSTPSCKPKSNVILQLTLSCASLHVGALPYGLFLERSVAHTRSSQPAFLWRETAWPNFEDSFKTKSVLSVRWRNISDKQREKEHERARIHRQSISNKQREKKHEQTG